MPREKNADGCTFGVADFAEFAVPHHLLFIFFSIDLKYTPFLYEFVVDNQIHVLVIDTAIFEATEGRDEHSILLYCLECLVL